MQAYKLRRCQTMIVTQTGVLMTGLIGYARVSKADGSHVYEIQCNALFEAGVAPSNLYEDFASSKEDDRPGLAACLKALHPGDTLVVWKLDRLGRDLSHLVNLIDELAKRSIGLKVLTGEGVSIGPSTTDGGQVLAVFAALVEFERALIIEGAKAALVSPPARGRNGGAPLKMTTAKLWLAQAAMEKPETNVADLCDKLGITRATLYRYVGPIGELRADGIKLLDRDEKRN